MVVVMPTMEPTKGLLYSHTSSPSRVTSKMRPCQDSQITVFPLGNRSDPAQTGE